VQDDLSGDVTEIVRAQQPIAVTKLLEVFPAEISGLRIAETHGDDFMQPADGNETNAGGILQRVPGRVRCLRRAGRAYHHRNVNLIHKDQARSPSHHMQTDRHQATSTIDSRRGTTNESQTELQ
jgi:hypothetical protein